MIKNRYFVVPSIVACITIIIVIGFFKIITISCDDLVVIASSSNTAALTFSTTFIAFAIAALALLQLIQNTEWYKEVKASEHYQSLISRLLFSIEFCLILLMYSLISFFIISVKQQLLLQISTSIQISMIVFILVWIWQFIREYLRIFR